MSDERNFEERLKRVKKRLPNAPPPTGMNRRAAFDKEMDDGDISPIKLALPPVGLLLGLLAFVLGRSVAISQIGVEASSTMLTIPEGVVIVIMLAIFGLILGKSNYVALIAMVVGALLAFYVEPFIIAAFPDLMETIYSPDYVARSSLGL